MTSPNDLDQPAGYAEAVRAALGDLSADERASLLDDLEAHLAEVAAESRAPLVERLGSPEDYAAELRAAYGARPGRRRRRRVPRRRLAYLFLVVPIALGLWIAIQAIFGGPGADRWSADRLVSEAQAGHVSSVDITGAVAVATDRQGRQHDVSLPPGSEPIAATLTAAGVNVSYRPSSPIVFLHPAWVIVTLVVALAPIAVLALLAATLLLRRPAGPRGAV